MKKFYTSFVFTALASVALFGQPVITNATFTNNTTVLSYRNAGPLWLATFNPDAISGPNVIWNYPGFEVADLVTESFVPVNSTPLTYQFFFNNQFLYPNSFSNHALPIDASTAELPIPVATSDAYSFFRNAGNGYYATGFAATVEGFPLPLTVPYTTADKIFKFPLNYQDTNESNSSLSLAVPTFGYYGQDAIRNSVVDGWGTLQTPYGIYEVLRVRAERFITDTIYIEESATGQSIDRPIQIDYAWLSTSVPGPVMQASVIGGQVVSARILDGVGPTGISETALTGISVFPNPAVQYVNVYGLNRPSVIRVFCTDGKLVYSENTAGPLAQIEVQNLPIGMYMVQVINEGGSFTTRFVVAR